MPPTGATTRERPAPLCYHRPAGAREVEYGGRTATQGGTIMIATSIQSIHDDIVARLADGEMVGVGRLDAAAAAPIVADAAGILPGAKSVVVVASEIFAEVLDLVTPEKTTGEAAARELYAPHLDYLNGRMNRVLYELARAYRKAGYRAVPMPSAGTPSDARFQRGILSFKGAAVLAGLGMIGQNSLLVTPQYGPRVRLACLLTDAELAAADMLTENPCDGCGKCVQSCPRRAVRARGRRRVQHQPLRLLRLPGRCRRLLVVRAVVSGGAGLTGGESPSKQPRVSHTSSEARD